MYQSSNVSFHGRLTDISVVTDGDSFRVWGYSYLLGRWITSVAVDSATKAGFILAAWRRESEGVGA